LIHPRGSGSLIVVAIIGQTNEPPPAIDRPDPLDPALRCAQVDKIGSSVDAGIRRTPYFADGRRL
jgi:hypothetical protein